MTDDSQLQPASEPLVAIPQGMGPLLAEIIPYVPEAGHVYLNLGIARLETVQERTQKEQLAQRLIAANAALLSAGIDPLTLQPVAATPTGNGKADSVGVTGEATAAS